MIEASGATGAGEPEGKIMTWQTEGAARLFRGEVRGRPARGCASRGQGR